MNYLVIDLEMCNVPRDYRSRSYKYANETIQIGAVLLDEEFKRIGTLSQYVHPEHGVIDPFIQNLTGIRNSQVKKAPRIEEALLHMISWKRLLRIQSNEKHGTYKTRRKMLMDLINDPLFDINDIGGGLINICNRDIGKITNWRKYFISVPGVMDALHDYSAYKPKERYIRIEGDNIFLMGSTRLYGYNKEYYSFALCCMLECLGKYSVRYEDAKGWEDIHHQIEVTEKSTGEVYEIKYRRSDKKFSIYKKDGSATVYANLEDTFNALK